MKEKLIVSSNKDQDTLFLICNIPHLIEKHDYACLFLNFFC